MPLARGQANRSFQLYTEIPSISRIFSAAFAEPQRTLRLRAVDRFDRKNREDSAKRFEEQSFLAMTWVKICGITNLEDALVAVEAGADALGFVFYEKSPRNLNPNLARTISQAVPPGIEKVGLFVNQQEQSMRRIADQVGLTAVQMHGNDEDPHVADLVAAQCSLKVLVGVSMSRPSPEGWAMMWEQKNVYAFLADSGSSAKLGGTGERFDWRASLGSLNTLKTLSKLVVAGGLNSSNVVEAMKLTTPWGVDVSSGVESRPGKKDPEKVRAFIKAVREADKASSN